jgi:hypothetical protein
LPSRLLPAIAGAQHVDIARTGEAVNGGQDSHCDVLRDGANVCFGLFEKLIRYKRSDPSVSRRAGGCESGPS